MIFPFELTSIVQTSSQNIQNPGKNKQSKERKKNWVGHSSVQGHSATLP